MRKTIRTTLLFILLISLSACNYPGVNSLPIAQVPAAGSPLLWAPANATATPTPFQPLAPTATYLPTQTQLPPTLSPTSPPTPLPTQRVWGAFPGPTAYADIAIPGPAGRLPQPDGQINILLLGSDQRQGDYGFRTDTIVLLTLNPQLGTASLTSFPRDLYVYIPGWTMQRINTAMGFGGFDTLAMTFAYNFGVWPDFYVMINLWSFQEVIDSLGGIDVQVAVPLRDQRTGHGFYRVPAGEVHMDGETALWYVRSRKTTSDFDRTRRQQEVIQAAFQKMVSLDAIKRAPELYNIYSENVTTDMTFANVLPYVTLAAKLSDTSRIKRYYIGREHVSGWVTSSGAQVLLPYREAVLGVMRQALNIP